MFGEMIIALFKVNFNFIWTEHKLIWSLYTFDTGNEVVTASIVRRRFLRETEQKLRNIAGNLFTLV